MTPEGYIKQALSLRGYFCKVNKYGRLKFRYVGLSVEDTDNTCEEYAKLCRVAKHHLGEQYTDYIREKQLGVDKYGNVISGDNTGNKDVEDNKGTKDVEDTNNTKDKNNTKDTTQKSPVHLPFDERGFTIAMPKWIKKIPPDIVSRVGLICTVRAKAIPYNFTSRTESNFGENIVGIQLVFTSMGV